MESKWYTIKVQPNREKTSSDRIKLEMNKSNVNMNIVIPMEKIFFVKNGRKAFKEKVLYPGYIFIESNNMSSLQDILKSSIGVSGIVKNKDGSPSYLRDSEVKKLFEEDVNSVKDLVENYLVGEEVNIISGPFSNFKGKIEEFSLEKGKARVSVLIFGRPTNVDLTTDMITKVI